VGKGAGLSEEVGPTEGVGVTRSGESKGEVSAKDFQESKSARASQMELLIAITRLRFTG